MHTSKQIYIKLRLNKKVHIYSFGFVRNILHEVAKHYGFLIINNSKTPKAIKITKSNRGIPIIFQQKEEILFNLNSPFNFSFSLSNSGSLILSKSKNSFPVTSSSYKALKN